MAPYLDLTDGIGDLVGQFLHGRRRFEPLVQEGFIQLELVALGEDCADVKADADHRQGEKDHGNLPPVFEQESEEHYTSPRYLSARLKITRGYSLTAS